MRWNVPIFFEARCCSGTYMFICPMNPLAGCKRCLMSKVSNAKRVSGAHWITLQRSKSIADPMEVQMLGSTSSFFVVLWFQIVLQCCFCPQPTEFKRQNDKKYRATSPSFEFIPNMFPCWNGHCQHSSQGNRGMFPCLFWFMYQSRHSGIEVSWPKPYAPDTSTKEFDSDAPDTSTKEFFDSERRGCRVCAHVSGVLGGLSPVCASRDMGWSRHPHGERWPW